MALFSKQNKEVFTNPLNLDHPILGQVLGICSALAVTSQLKPAIVMGLAVTVITAFANVIISIIRNTIPNRIRIVVQLVVVAALVTIVSQILKAFVDHVFDVLLTADPIFYLFLCSGQELGGDNHLVPL
jgi:Na+-transporting NADH:ubiquinone oxidoreductase subunit D